MCGALVAHAAVASAQGRADPKKELLGIVRTLQNGAITKIEVVAMPKQVETIVGMTPDLLQKHCSVLISMRDLSAIAPKLASDLQNTRAVAFDGSSDPRRGVLFYSKDRVVASIYFDPFTQGQIDGVKAKFSGALLPWVESHIPSEYR